MNIEKIIAPRINSELKETEIDRIIENGVGR